MLNLIRIFDGSFGGPTLYENPSYTSPNEVGVESLMVCIVLRLNVYFVEFVSHLLCMKVFYVGYTRYPAGK